MQTVCVCAHAGGVYRALPSGQTGAEGELRSEYWVIVSQAGEPAVAGPRLIRSGSVPGQRVCGLISELPLQRGSAHQFLSRDRVLRNMKITFIWQR